MLIKAMRIDYRIENLNYSSNNPDNGNLFVRFKSPARVLTDAGYIDASPGDFIFYDKYEPSAYSYENGTFNHDYFRFFMDEGEEYLFSVKTSKLYTFPLSDRCEDVLRLINLEYYSKSKMREETLDLLGKLFLLTVKGYLDEQSEFPKTPRYEELLQLRCEILNSPDKKWKIEDIAQKVFMSPSVFQKTYKKCFGVSPINDLIKARINKAGFLLRYTDKNETEISKICGYNNVEHFVRQFKKHKNSTPSKYRRMNQSTAF